MQGRREASSGVFCCLSGAACSVLGTGKLSIKTKVNQAGVEREEGMEEWEQGMPLLSATCFSRFKVGALLCN